MTKEKEEIKKILELLINSFEKRDLLAMTKNEDLLLTLLQYNEMLISLCKMLYKIVEKYS